MLVGDTNASMQTPFHFDRLHAHRVDFSTDSMHSGRLPVQKHRAILPFKQNMLKYTGSKPGLATCPLMKS